MSGDNVGLFFIGVVGRVVTNLRSYGDSVNLGLVESGVGSAWNMRFRRSSVQYRSNGVDRRDSSLLFISVAGSTRTTCRLGGVRGWSIGVREGSGFGSISIRNLELSLLVVRRNGTFEVMVKSSVTLGDIGDGVESPGCMTAVGGEEVYHGR